MFHSSRVVFFVILKVIYDTFLLNFAVGRQPVLVLSWLIFRYCLSRSLCAGSVRCLSQSLCEECIGLEYMRKTCSATVIAEHRKLWIMFIYIVCINVVSSDVGEAQSSRKRMKQSKKKRFLFWKKCVKCNSNNVGLWV